MDKINQDILEIETNRTAHIQSINHPRSKDNELGNIAGAKVQPASLDTFNAYSNDGLIKIEPLDMFQQYQAHQTIEECGSEGI